jgi:hypothetical protein
MRQIETRWDRPLPSDIEKVEFVNTMGLFPRG